MTPQSKTENIVNSWNTACHVFPALISFLYEPRTAILSPKSGVEWGGWGGVLLYFMVITLAST